MTSETIASADGSGRVLFENVFGKDGKRILYRGHNLKESDLNVLEGHGITLLSVVKIEEGECSEDDAAITIAQAAACGAFQFELLPGGAVAAIATDNCCVIVDVALLAALNTASAVQISTKTHLSFARAGERIMLAKSTPFAAPEHFIKSQLDRLAIFVGEELTNDLLPVMQARPTRGSVAVIFTQPTETFISSQPFESVLRTRMSRFEAAASRTVHAIEKEEIIAAQIRKLAATPGITGILIASPTVPATPSDTVGRAMFAAGCSIDSFMAPVDPGSLLLMGYIPGADGDIAVVSAPGCWRQARPNILDLLIPAMLSSYRVSPAEIAALGNGGLLA